MSDCLLHVEQLRTYLPVRRGAFRRPRGHIRAVDDVSLTIRSGRTLGLIGLSGSGKTTLARSILRLVQPTAGRVLFEGADILSAHGRRLRQLRRKIGLVFQDPANSLNPRMTVGAILAEAIDTRECGGAAGLPDKVRSLLAMVGLPVQAASQYPHQFSAGQRQRIAIARAFAAQPKLVICDEPVGALDVSIQAQILNLLSDLQQMLSVAYLFITHDLAVAAHFCDEIAVMHAGRIIETALTADLFRDPRHPHTRSLIAAGPDLGRSHRVAHKDLDAAGPI